MIVVTGASGFIGICLIKKLLDLVKPGDLILVDDFTDREKEPRSGFAYQSQRIDRAAFIAWLEQNHFKVSCIFHMGARTDTAELNTALFHRLNLQYSQALWNLCAAHDITFIYASSAATYGDGSL